MTNRKVTFVDAPSGNTVVVRNASTRDVVGCIDVPRIQRHVAPRPATASVGRPLVDGRQLSFLERRQVASASQSSGSAPARPGRDAERVIGLVWWLLVAFSAVWLVATLARAQESDAIWLARVCSYESDTREADCKAIFFIGVKRAAITGEPPITMLLRYSTLMQSRSARGRRIRAGTPPDALLELASELLAGKHADPCKSATHWGGRTDAARGRMVPARCSMKTVNTFYRLGPSLTSTSSPSTARETR
jgi:hypothetical protein